MALSRAKRLCRSTEPGFCVMAPCFGVCHLCLAAVCASTNGLFLHVSVCRRVLISLSCRDLWILSLQRPQLRLCAP